MKKLIAFAAMLSCLFAAPAYSRDTAHMLSIDDTLATADAKEVLDGSIQFFFADEPHPAVDQRMVEVVTNKKTNAFGKSDVEACEWVFLSAMVALQDRAKREGGNAVVGITSYYKKNEMASTEEFECHAGNIIAGVALKGRIVKLAE